MHSRNEAGFDRPLTRTRFGDHSRTFLTEPECCKCYLPDFTSRERWALIAGTSQLLPRRFRSDSDTTSVGLPVMRAIAHPSDRRNKLDNQNREDPARSASQDANRVAPTQRKKQSIHLLIATHRYEQRQPIRTGCLVWDLQRRAARTMVTDAPLFEGN